jgi:adenine/guanine phosphoribosyltransferase-like PRPP-binding protein
MKAKKTAKNIQYVIPIGNAWAVKSGDSAKFTVITTAKKEAIAFATQVAKHYESELIVYGKNGQILITNNYYKKSRKVTAKA